MNLAGKVSNQLGVPQAGLTVELYEAAIWEAEGAATASTTTDAEGKWAFSGKDITKTWVVVALSGTKKTVIDAQASIQLTELDLITKATVDTIDEHTAAAGVTIDGVNISDHAANASAHHAKTAVETANSILRKIQQFKGVFWFNNHWLPAGMMDQGASGSGTVSFYVNQGMRLRLILEGII